MLYITVKMLRLAKSSEVLIREINAIRISIYERLSQNMESNPNKHCYIFIALNSSALMF